MFWGFITVMFFGYFMIKALRDEEGRMFLGLAAAVIIIVAAFIYMALSTVRWFSH